MGFTGNATSSSSSFSTKWILWQYDALVRSPLEGVNAAPLESNIFQWHGNFYFPEDHEFYPSLVLHFVLYLPRDFPNSTPDIELLTTIAHSHVFGGRICFSLLKSFEDHFHGLPDTVFWNPSRSIRSLLESVYIFLTVDEDRYRHYSSSETKISLDQARRCSCFECGHKPFCGKICPPEENWLAARVGSASVESDNGEADAAEERVCALAMYEDTTTPGEEPKKTTPKPKPKLSATERLANIRPVVVSINSSTSISNQKALLELSFEKRLALLKVDADEMMSVALQQDSSASLDTETIEDLRCSMTGVAFDHSDKVVLGFGVNVERRFDGSIAGITTDLSPISMEIFLQGRVRKSALGAPITHFLPFAINEQHWKRAKWVLPGCVDAILAGSRDVRDLHTDEEKLLFVVGEMWKSMAVLMMKGHTHASEKVLKGFCALHHLLLLAADEVDPLSDPNSVLETLVSRSATGEREDEPSWVTVVRRKNTTANKKRSDPSLLQVANHKVRGFAKNRRLRHKAQCPDFGRFLPMILLSAVSWDEVKKPFLSELLARNARWICQSSPSLAVVAPNEHTSLSDRAAKSWGASATGLKLTAFQICFFHRVVQWASTALPADVVQAYRRWNKPQLAVRAMYDALGGRPSAKMLSDFQQEAKCIESMTNFKQFFKRMVLPLTDLEIQVMLCHAMQSSARFGYHRAATVNRRR